MRSTSDYLVSAITAILAGMCIAGSGVLQQREASRRPSDERLSGLLLRRLVTDRIWLLGMGLAALSYGFQAVALSFGPLALVQPLVVSELLFAIPLSVRLHGLRLRKRDWLAVLVVIAGLAVGITSADPSKGHPVQPFTTWVPPLVAVAVLTTAAVFAGRVLQGPPKASAFALGGAVMMALQSALYAATIALLRDRRWALFETWEPYLLVVVSIVGVFLIQNAFQSGPLAASTPVIDATLPIVAVVLGIWVLDEHVRQAWWAYIGDAAGIGLLLAGIVGLDISPVVRREQRIERQQQQRTADRESRLRR